MYVWDFDMVWRNKMVFVEGGWLTVQITALSIVFGTVGGSILGLGRASKSLWVRLPVSGFVELFLALPVLVILVWVYYCAPLLLGISLSGFWTAVVVLSFSLSAFVAEIVRAGLLAVPKGQVEAARVLGMTKSQALMRVTVPQALRVIIPPLLGMYISTLKLSSLASFIAVYELLHSAQNLIMNSYRPLEVYTTVAFVYLILILPLALITRHLEAAKWWRMS